jgi:hypothetical protein
VVGVGESEAKRMLALNQIKRVNFNCQSPFYLIVMNVMID